MSGAINGEQRATITPTLGRYRGEIDGALREAIRESAHTTPRTPASSSALAKMYAQIEYHLGWRSEDLSPAESNPGKLLRPTLVLLTAELAGGREAVTRALPAAVAIELIHNFSLIHDDIEDRDEARRGRPTLWKAWGQAQAINTGDALFALARSRLLELMKRGVTPENVVRLVGLVDGACLELCEGQHLDMSFEGRREVTEAMYLDMIGRKTAALMRCAAELGARVGAPEDGALGDRLAAYGQALGLGFQLRDDVLGIWSATQLGKSEAGDIRRKKMTLPVIHALERASAKDRASLNAIYAERGPATDDQVARALAILDRAGSRKRAYTALKEQLDAATSALADALALARVRHSGAEDVASELATLIAFIQADAENQ
ncbi:MAG TPA: polyprenyl synthetase family protein [Ktedonobacterales bacterium]